MKDIDKVKLLGIFLIIVIAISLSSIISTIFSAPLSDEDLHFDKLNVYTLPSWTEVESWNDTNISHICKWRELQHEPLYYRNGTIAGWMINGNFSRTPLFNIMFFVRYNTTHGYNELHFP